MPLLWWAIIALMVSITAGVFGFTGVASTAATIGKVLFGIFLMAFTVLLTVALMGVAAVPPIK